MKGIGTWIGRCALELKVPPGHEACPAFGSVPSLPVYEMKEGLPRLTPADVLGDDPGR